MGTGVIIERQTGVNIKRRNENIRLISTPSVVPKRVFWGRDDILQQINAAFSDGERIVFLFGIGGIGKTQIAKQYAKLYKQNYDVIIYATYNDGIRNMIIADNPFAFEPPVTRLIKSDGSTEDDVTFYNRKLALIKKHSNERTLIILDNFDVANDDYLTDLVDANFHLLVTSRCDYSRDYKTIKIDPIISIAHLKEIFLQNYSGDDVDKDDPKLIELIELVNRHTYTIELLALHMENSGQTADEMIDALKKEGIVSLNEAVRNSDMKTQVAYENLLRMFNVFTLNEEEKNILMYLSLMPLEGVNSRDFREWANLKSSQSIMNLEKRSWILKSVDGIALHPIVRDVVKNRLPATEKNCTEFIERFTEAISEKYTWHFNKEKKEKYGTIALSMIQSFPNISETTLGLYKNAETLLSFAIKPQTAVALAEEIYKYVSYNLGETSFDTGWICYKLGWAYVFNVQLPNSIENSKKWLEKSYSILSQMDLNTELFNLTLQQVLRNLSKVYLRIFENTNVFEDYENAKKYAKLAVDKNEYWYSLGKIEHSNVAGGYLQLADVYISASEFESAKLFVDKAYNILYDLFGEKDSDTLFAMSRKAAVLYGMSRYDEAADLISKTLDDYNAFYNTSVYFHGYELLVLQLRCFVALNKKPEAKQTYNKAVEIATNMFEEGANQLRILDEIFYSQN